MMMMSFNCSYRNKNEPSAIYPSFGGRVCVTKRIVLAFINNST
jgi:hypothetical protein